MMMLWFYVEMISLSEMLKMYGKNVEKMELCVDGCLIVFPPSIWSKHAKMTNTKKLSEKIWDRAIICHWLFDFWVLLQPMRTVFNGPFKVDDHPGIVWG